MRKSTRLRELLTEGRTLRVVGAHTGLSAVLAEEAGFDAVWVSSFEVSASRALPDASVLTMTEYLQAAMHVDRACRVPVVADCDTGFGNSLNVAHMIREYEAAGIAAVCVEDKVFPKVNSFSERGQCLVDADEFAHRISVAKEAQQTRDFLVVARTEAYIAGYGTEEALARATAYAEAGADAILVHSKQSSSGQIQEFLAAWEGCRPVVVVPTTYYSWHIADMQRAGVSMCIYANHGIRSTVSAMRRTLQSIKESGTSIKVEDEIASMHEIFALQQLDDWLALEP